MTLTGKQAHVLANLDRVRPRPFKIRTADQRVRFGLENQDCTPQITALVVRKMIRHEPGGTLARL